MAVSDLDETMEDLASRGVAFERYDQPGLKTDERGVFGARRFRAAWIMDPDGSTMALTELSGAPGGRRPEGSRSV